MSEKYDIAIIGGDLRQVYMANEFIKRGYKTIVYGLKSGLLNENAKSADSLKDALLVSTVIICPVPFTKNQIDITSREALADLKVDDLLNGIKSDSILFGGNIPENVLKYCIKNNIEFHDFMTLNDIAILNAIATAEGAIAEAISKSAVNLHQSSCLVLGFGRCAKVLAKKLYSLDASVSIAARSKDARAEAAAYGYYTLPLDDLESVLPQCDFIFNTIPSVILTKSELKKVSRDVTIIDIASSPGGIDYAAAEAFKINASLCPSLPGKYSPRSSGEILFKAIEDIIIESSD